MRGEFTLVGNVGDRSDLYDKQHIGITRIQMSRGGVLTIYLHNGEVHQHRPEEWEQFDIKDTYAHPED